MSDFRNLAVIGSINSVYSVLPVSADVGLAWCQGRLDDMSLVSATAVNPLPHSPFLVILRLDGHAAGMRRLFWFLARQVQLGVQVSGFGMRTRLPGVERVFGRFYGKVTFDEGDGDRRWAAPAYPGVDFLRTWGEGPPQGPPQQQLHSLGG